MGVLLKAQAGQRTASFAVEGGRNMAFTSAASAAAHNVSMQILEVMCDDGISLCLSPQGFSNVNPATDIYNNANQ
jgi:hypothetical protein